MNKKEFINELESRLTNLPKKEIDDYIDFYSEAIDDRIEDGKTEDEAVADLGGIDNVIYEIAKEKSIPVLVKEKFKPKRRISGLEIFLLILGFPLWFPLLLTCLVLILVAYFLIWILVIVTYSVESGLIGYGVVGLIACFAKIGSKISFGYLGFSLAGIGGAMLFLFVCYLATKVTLKFTKRIALGIKKSLIDGGSKNA